MLRLLGFAFLFILPGWWLIPALPPTETAAELFDSGVLHDVRLYVHSRDLQRLRAGYLDNTYYPADFVWKNVRVRDVAIRSRGGLATRDATKIGLRIDFNRYTPRQTFAGLQAVVLDNLLQDPAIMRELLAMSVYRRMGQPAPRESFCRLYINNEYQGVYALVEEIDQTFVTDAFGTDTGYLFEYQWAAPWFGDDLGDDLARYRVLFEPKTHERAGDDELYGPVRALVAAINAPDGTSSRADLERYVDLGQVVTALAIDTLLGEEDGLAGMHGMNNFYLYRRADSVRHSFLPWDRDRALKGLTVSIFERLDSNALSRQALSYGDLYEAYLQALEDGARLLARDEWLSREIERLWVLLEAAAQADARKPFSNEEMADALEFLREFASIRPGLVLAEVAAARSSAPAR